MYSRKFAKIKCNMSYSSIKNTKPLFDIRGSLHGFVLLSLVAVSSFVEPEFASFYFVAVVAIYGLMYGMHIDKDMKSLVFGVILIVLP